jgi:uncharacterized membrane protein YeiH
LARRPDHYRNWTVVGILLMALLMGLGGGMTRDVLINKVPGALTNPAYIIFALRFGTVGYFLAYGKGQLFRDGLFQFMTSFSLPFYAIVGGTAGVTAGLPVAGVLALAVIGPTAGRGYVDISSGVPPKQFIKGEWFVITALGTGAIWLACDAIGLGTWVCVAIAFVFGYTFRVIALYRAWEEPLASEPAGVYRHDNGRPMLSRKLKEKPARRNARPRTGHRRPPRCYRERGYRADACDTGRVGVPHDRAAHESARRITSDVRHGAVT